MGEMNRGDMALVNGKGDAAKSYLTANCIPKISWKLAVIMDIFVCIEIFLCAEEFRKTRQIF